VSILIEDSPRNLLAWIESALGSGSAQGAVLSPFATPWITKTGPGGRRGAQDVAPAIDALGAVFFDATTHALQMAGVGDFRYYDEYSLWSGARGDLSTPPLREQHIRRVFEVQSSLGAPHLGPTVLLHHGESTTSQLALEVAREAVTQDPDCWLTIAGTAPFWASEGALDAHIGALAQLEPKGWFISVARPYLSLPVEGDAEEVHGVCRTARALSEYAPVHVSHGDLAGLPAVAAGAQSVGTGWDQRQRVCAFGSYGAREAGAGGGGWYERPTYPGLLGSLKTNESAVLVRRDSARATRLGPPPPPGPKEAFMHHARVLYELADSVLSQPSLESRYRRLDRMYTSAAAEWPAVAAITGSALSSAEWVDQHRSGLRLYGVGEGW
jgi:hypothetical protein